MARYAEFIHAACVAGYMRGALKVAKRLPLAAVIAMSMNFAAAAPAGEFTPKDALKLLENKRLMSPKAFKALDAGYKKYAFTVAGQDVKRMIPEIHQRLVDAVKSGQSQADFVAAVDKAFEAAGVTRMNKFHLETVFRNNVMSSYAAANWDMLHSDAAMEYFPTYTFIATPGCCEICEQCDGVTLPADDPYWRTHWGQLHHCCRCTQIANDAEAAAKLGIVKPPPNALPPDDGFGTGGGAEAHWATAEKTSAPTPGQVPATPPTPTPASVSVPTVTPTAAPAPVAAPTAEPPPTRPPTTRAENPRTDTGLPWLPPDKQIPLTVHQEAQVATPAFEKFYGQGLRDAEGRPVVLYHGTDQDFSQFAEVREKKGYEAEQRPGTWYFSDSPVTAAGYTTATSPADPSIPVEKLMELPAGTRVEARRLTSRGWESLPETTPRGKGIEYQVLLPNGEFIHNSVSEVSPEDARRAALRSLQESPFGFSGGRGYAPGANIKPVFVGLQNPMIIEAEGGSWKGRIGGWIDDARRGGHDGLIVRDIVDRAIAYDNRRATTVVAFQPGQIKSAICNTGRFDVTQPEMWR